ncbi:hypothetical protein L7F22_010228 [Adiantum nelumboides]|nr:hypothetical protein [Adiantum nelumboides]
MNVSSGVVHLLHSASGLALSYVASPEAHVDVGTIAAHFSLQPNSVRFNDHFISRDAHFISGLTWRELLDFFQSRGFNWGSHSHNSVEVHGRPLLRPSNEGFGANPNWALIPVDEHEARGAGDGAREGVQEVMLGAMAWAAGALASNEKSESAKRFSLHSSLVSPSKRRKLECDSDVLTQSLTPCKLKRQVLAEEPSLCPRSKQMRHEKNLGRWDGDSEHTEGEVVCGSKRKKPSDDVSTERSLWKRLKEVKV